MLGWRTLTRFGISCKGSLKTKQWFKPVVKLKCLVCACPALKWSGPKRNETRQPGATVDLEPTPSITIDEKMSSKLKTGIKSFGTEI